MFDEWVELVPAAEVTTGVAFNYDAPGARPPQTRAARGRAARARSAGSVETLEQILLETLELAQLRAVDPQASAATRCSSASLPALYVTGNLAGETFSTDFTRAAS